MSPDQFIEHLTKKLFSFHRGFSATTPPETIFPSLLDLAIELFKAERGYVILIPNQAIIGRSDQKEFLPVSLHESVFNLIEQVKKNRQSISTTGIIDSVNRSIFCAPINFAQELIAVVYLDSGGKKGFFDEQLLGAFEIYASSLGGIFQGHLLHQKLMTYHLQLQRVAQQLKVAQEEVKKQLALQEHMLEQMRVELRAKYHYKNIIGQSSVMQQLMSQVTHAIGSDGPLLILGERGVGKELLAKTIHYNGPRSEATFVSANCRTISPTMMEEELFGSFEPSKRVSRGLFEIAEKGTIYLEQVDALDLGMQKKLLAAIKDQRIKPLGSRDTKPANTRVIFSSERDLSIMVNEELFLKELHEFFKGNLLEIPPLRERGEDLDLIIKHTLEQIAEEQGTTPHPISKEAINLLYQYPWPGNILELIEEIRKASSRSEGAIEKHHLSENIHRGTELPHIISLEKFEGKSLQDILEVVEGEMVKSTLERTRGNKAKTAKILGISRTTLYEKLGKLGIE